MIIYRADELKFAKTYELNEEYIELLSLLEKINPCNQYYEAGEDYLIISYEIKLNLFNFRNLPPLAVKAQIIGLPLSLSHKGYFGDLNKVLEAVKKRKGLKIILNADEEIIKGGRTLSTFVFGNRFENFDDYLNKLRSPYRRRINKALKCRNKLRINKIRNRDFNEDHYRLYLSIMKRTEKTPDEAETAIALIVRNLTGAKLRCVERVVIAPNYYVFKFKNLKKIKIRTYTATAVKDGSLVSGDNFAYAGRADKYYVVLCDGIGSGEEAHSESNSALDLMSRFLYSDFTEEQILRTLNSVLMIALGDDRYVTFDFTVIDYGTKEMRLYKAGAAPSYILSNKGVDKITGKSLPLGILDNFEYSSFKKQINIGDMLVMVSDGIIDSINLDPKKSLDKYLESLTKKDPQTAANSILSYALIGQDKIIDDMTVLVTKIG
jgi:serine/threonine protein phosphatase PrpC